jgi:quinoprotein glucose dehydrogenase
MCHGIDRAGQPPAFPSLIGVHDRLSNDAIAQTIRSGKGRMPAFSDFTPGQLNDIIRYVTAMPIVDRTASSTREMQASAGTPAGSTRRPHDVPYKFSGYKKFLDPDGYPAVSTPWGTLNAIDLKTGKYLWKIPFGEYPELTAKGIPITGSENYGGPVITAGGVLFIGATEHDQKLHAYEASSGKLLWEGTLPFSVVSTPATYMEKGRQFVVVGAGGGKDIPEHRGGIYVAFTLK